MLGSFPPELRGRLAATSLLRSEEPTLSCNHSSRSYRDERAGGLGVVPQGKFSSKGKSLLQFYFLYRRIGSHPCELPRRARYCTQIHLKNRLILSFYIDYFRI
jgi:hypothetical protein